MVGGWIIETRVVRLPDNELALRIWVVGRKTTDECVVYAEPHPNLPLLATEIWWQGDRIFYNHDTCCLRKIGYSHAPGVAERAEH